MSILRRIGICVIGVLFSFLLMTVFVEIDMRMAASRAMDDQILPRAVESAWLFRWIFNPLIIVGVSSLVAILGTGSGRTPLSTIAVLPFVLLFLAANSFTVSSLAIAGGYLVLALASSALVSQIKK